MRSRIFVAMILSATACGDDGGTNVPIDSPPAIDMLNIDAPPACTLPASIPASSVGMMNMRGSGDWVRTAMGTTAFAIRIDIEMPVGGVANAFLLVYEKPNTGFVLNQALAFNTSPTSMAPVDFQFFEKLNPAMGTSLRLLIPSSGTITFSALGEAMGAPTTAMISATSFREVNPMTGADVPGGCSSQLAGLTLYLTESTAVAGSTAGAIKLDVPSVTLEVPAHFAP